MEKEYNCKCECYKAGRNDTAYGLGYCKGWEAALSRVIVLYKKDPVTFLEEINILKKAK
jgi:hypothetical protein